MMRHVDYFVYLLVIFASVSLPGIRADTSPDFAFSHNELDLKIDENFAVDSTKGAFSEEKACNGSGQCLNGGRCLLNDCICPKEYEGLLCETPTFCSWGRCGFGGEVECVWDFARNRGECRCTKENHVYQPKQRKCLECDCGGHGKCEAVDDVLACKCDDRYALKSSSTKCEACDCGPWSERCSFTSSGQKVCQCPRGFAQKTVRWPSYGERCESCDCGEHGRCSWNGDEKLCDCEAGYRLFREQCVDCDCGRFGICNLDPYGDKVCSCDYGYAEKEGRCEDCDCNSMTTSRTSGVNCSFVDGLKRCECPPGFEDDGEYCADVDECTSGMFRPCTAGATCINKPGTYECRCGSGYRLVPATWDPNVFGCEDIDECLDRPCTSHLTDCVNTPGSFDCVCREGFYATSGTQGSAYKPAYNNCYEIPTQWRAATIALGVILSFGIIGISCYIMKHKKSS